MIRLYPLTFPSPCSGAALSIDPPADGMATLYKTKLAKAISLCYPFCGGKAIVRNRDVGSYFRISDEEKQQLVGMLEASNLHLSEFIRYTLFGFPKPSKMRISKTIERQRLSA